jgi:two-component system, NtrC family, response regulator GlrR
MLPDFRYRLPHIVIRIPSLAERREEILGLATAQANASAVKLARGTVVAWTPEAIQAILCAPWTGNIRELLRVVEGGVAGMDATGDKVGPITPADLGLPDPPAGGAHRCLERPVLRKVVQELLAKGCSQELAGECVGMHRNSVRNLLREPETAPARLHNESCPLAS